jgi:hypothetical protein
LSREKCKKKSQFLLFFGEIDENVQIFLIGFFAHFRQNLGYFCSIGPEPPRDYIPEHPKFPKNPVFSPYHGRTWRSMEKHGIIGWK